MAVTTELRIEPIKPADAIAYHAIQRKMFYSSATGACNLCHYVDFPFKPEGEPANIPAMQPPEENILTGIAVNEQILRSGNDPGKRGIALSCLFQGCPPVADCIARFIAVRCAGSSWRDRSRAKNTASQEKNTTSPR